MVETYWNIGKYIIENVTLEEIYSLYKFDIEIRTNFLKYILSLERRLNTYIAYEFSKNYGHKNYLVEENFDNNNDFWTSIQILWINESKRTKLANLSFIAIFVLSVIFSIAFIKSKSIIVPTILHSYWDLLMILFIG